MAAKGIRHERVKTVLLNRIAPLLPRNNWFSVELGWRPDGETYCEPDLLVFPSDVVEVSKVSASLVLLLVAVADPSFKCDTVVKAPLFARLGVRDYWVVNSRTLRTRVFREPRDGDYVHVAEYGPEALLTPLLVPQVELRFLDLGLEPELS